MEILMPDDALEVKKETRCPVYYDGKAVLRLGNDLLLALRRMRKSTRRCEGCPQLETCSIWVDFNARIDQAIWEITQSWGV